VLFRSRDGVSVDLHETKGTYHGFELMEKSPLIDVSLQRRVQFMRECFYNMDEIGTFAEV
jgi:hypothetical protein